MVVLLEGSPISTEELWSSVRVTIGLLINLPDQDPSPPIAQFRRAASSRKSFGGSKRILFKNDGGHCVVRDLQCWTSNRKVATLNPRADKVKICCSAPEQGS